MKQHSYAFYNGYLSTLFKKRHHLLARLKQLRSLSRLPCPSLSPYLTTAAENRFLSGRPLITATSTPESDLARVAVAIDAGKPLGAEQVQLFESIITFEVRAVTEELKGKSTAPEREYPSNLTLENFARYIVLPTVVYELEYPRSKTINWGYVAEKGAATVGILMVMIMISQARMCESLRRNTLLLTSFFLFFSFSLLGGERANDGILSRPHHHKGHGHEGSRNPALAASGRVSVDISGAGFPIYDGVPAYVVPNLGVHS